MSSPQGDPDPSEPNLSAMDEDAKDPPPTSKYPPNQRVLLLGVDHVPKNVIVSTLVRLVDAFRRLPPTLRTRPSGRGIILSHPQAQVLFDLDLAEDMFGARTKFTVTQSVPRSPSIFIRGIPRNITNDDLLDLIQGACHVRRLRTSPSKAFIRVTSKVAAARLIRDGARVGRSNLICEVPLRQVCPRCFSTDHSRCDNNPKCFRCGSLDHMLKDCDQPIKCLHCDQNEDHFTRDCSQLRQWQRDCQRQDEEALLKLIPTLQDSLNGAEDPDPELPIRQQRHVEASRQDDGTRTYAQIVNSKIKARRQKRSRRQPNSNPAPANQPRNRRREDEADHRTAPNPVVAILDSIDTTGLKPQTSQFIRQKMQASLMDVLQTWMAQTNAMIKTAMELDKQADDEVKTHGMTNRQASRFDSGVWTITCQCGESFPMKDADVHETACELTRTQKKRDRRSSNTTDDDDDLEPIVIHDHGEPNQGPTATPKKKPSGSKRTPDAVRKLKGTIPSMFGTMDTPSDFDVESAPTTPTRSKSQQPHSQDSSRKSRQKHRAGGR